MVPAVAPVGGAARAPEMVLMKRRWLPLLAAVWLAAPAVTGAPVTDRPRVPIDLRRTTLVVEDAERSLAFYRDALGMRVVYDNIIRTPRDAADDASAQRSLRLIFVEANDDYVGLIGILEYRKPKKEPPTVRPAAFSIGTPVLLFNTTDVKATFERAKKVPGVEVIDEPGETFYPGYGGQGRIPVVVSTLRDPDGFTVELNQVLVAEPQKVR
jgi:catechol 2,3-dioxygenase-like lactoylglutathione lyase family enzyme